MALKKILYGKKADGKQNSWTAIQDWVLRKNYLSANAQVIYCLIIANSLGFGKKQYHKKVHKRDLANQKGLTPRATSKALNELRDKNLIDFPDNTGAKKIMIVIKDLVPNFAEQLEIKCDNADEESDNAVRECDNAVRVSEKVPTSPPSKELPKELNKELLKEEEIIKESFSIDEFFKKWTINGRVNIDKTNYAFNSISLEQQKKVIKSLPLAMKEYNSKELKYVPFAHNYILNSTFLGFYETALEKEKADRNANKQWENLASQRTPEQIEAIRREHEGK